MWALLTSSLFNHLSWWLRSFWPGQHPAAPLRLRRALFLLVGFPAFLALQFVHWLGFLLDECFFSAYRGVKVDAPVFILGIPRSGTTFLHRTLAQDQKFTSFATWEAILAPSITERKFFRALATLDRAIGAPFKRCLHYCLGKSSGDLHSIHPVGLSAPEEDYLALLPVGGCFIMLLAFPFATALQKLALFDQLDEINQTRLIGFYKRCLQKHLYCHPGKKLLSKNAAFSSWTSALQTAFPDARFLVCIRNPDSALSSQLSSLAPARRAFGTDVDGSWTAEKFTDFYGHAYQSLAAFAASSISRPEQAAIIEQSDLKRDHIAIIRAALGQLGMPAPPQMNTPSGDSGRPHHHHLSNFRVDSDRIETCMRPAYRAMLQSPLRSLPNPN